MTFIIDPYRFGSAAPAFVGAGAAASASATDQITVALPAGWAIGEFCMASLVLCDNVSAGLAFACTGWTRVGTDITSSVRLQHFYRVLQSGDGNPTFVWNGGGGSNAMVGRAFTYENISTVTHLGNYTKSAGDQFDSTPTNLSTTVNGSIMYSCAAVDFYQPLSLKGGSEQGFTSRGAASLASQGGLCQSDKVIDTAGSVTFPTYTGPQFSGHYFSHAAFELKV